MVGTGTHRRRCKVAAANSSPIRKTRWKKDAQKAAIQVAAKHVFEAKAKNGRRIPYGFMSKIMGEFASGEHKFTVAQVEYAVTVMEKKAAARVKVAAALEAAVPALEAGVPTVMDMDMSELDSLKVTLSGSMRPIGGRPKGSTKKAAKARSKAAKNALMEASLLYQKAKQNNPSEQLPRGTLKGIVIDVEAKNGLAPGTISPETVRTRVSRNNPSGLGITQISPVSVEVEGLICQYCIRLAKIGLPLTKDQVIGIALSLIEGTAVEENVKEWKKNYSHYDPTAPLLGSKWFQGFLKRHDEEFKRVRARVKDVQRFPLVGYCRTAIEIL
jgi:hypothetical protein